MMQYMRVGYLNNTGVELNDSNSVIVTFDNTPWWLRR